MYLRKNPPTSIEAFAASLRATAVCAEVCLRDPDVDGRYLRYYLPILNRVRSLADEVLLFYNYNPDRQSETRIPQKVLDSRNVDRDPPE